MKKLLLNLTMLLVALVCGGVTYGADVLTETVIVNENFDSGATLFTGKERMSVANDNNVKFTTTDKSLNNYSNATYDFDTKGAAAVKIQFSYWIANANCNYDVAFIIRDKDIAAGHVKQSMGLSGSFISIGRTRQSSTNFFSINQARTATASADNLGLWCNAEVYIDLIAKTVNYKITTIDGGTVIKEGTGVSFNDSEAASVNQIDFFACANSETDYLDNLVITKYTSSNPTYDYTINYVLDNTTVKTESGTKYAGETVTAKSPLTVDGQKYFVNDGQTTSMTITADVENTLNVSVRKAETYTLTVNAVDANNTVVKQLSKSEIYEGDKESFTYYVPKYITDENNKVTYQIAEDTYSYTQSITGSAAYTVKYNAYAGDAWFVEGEDVLKSTDVENGNYSNGHAHRGFDTLKNFMTVAQNGRYTMTYAVCSNNTNRDCSVTFYKNSGENIITENTKITHSVNYIKTTGTVSVSDVDLAQGDIIKVKPSTTNCIFDYILIEKTAETIALNDNYVHSTYCPESDLDFTNVEGVEVYKVKVSGNKAVSTKVEGKIQAGEGILLKKTGDATTVTVPTTTGAEKLTDNDLVGAKEAITDGWDNMNAYMLVSDTEFQKIGSGTLAKGKAYLLVSNASDTAAQSIYFGDEVNSDDPVTAINGVGENAGTQNGAIYTLQGVKVEKAEKGGIYIINGKKYIK